MVSASSLKPPIAILTGPTATGKTQLALELASRAGNIEIINADSLLVYRGMDIGTAKPSLADRARVPHHLIDIREPHEAFTAGECEKAARAAISDIDSRGKRALIVGGTGFYLKALLFGLWQAPKTDPAIREKLESESSESLFQRLEKSDPASALRIGVKDRYRLIRALEIIELSGKTPTELEAQAPKEPDPRFALWVLDRPNPELFSRIESRTQTLLQQGLIEEVKALRANYPGKPPRALSAVGYREVCDFLDGKQPEGRKISAGIAGLQSEISLSTRQLVKSQRTWFRSQTSARWFSLDAELPLFLKAWDEIYKRP